MNAEQEKNVYILFFTLLTLYRPFNTEALEDLHKKLIRLSENIAVLSMVLHLVCYMMIVTGAHIEMFHDRGGFLE